ncbi:MULTISPECIES: helix-turn-helix transcriptional regulator [Peptoniphilus]|uniref:Helix-turn-helix transcriptional regulator n=1 Tax=Peptoniphilus senegalensis TaxID=1465757 RepID=A0ABV1J234_9FIRM
MKTIIELREKKGLSQQELAKMLGISNVSLHYYESNQRYVPKNIAEKIADIFEVELDDIFLPQKFSFR